MKKFWNGVLWVIRTVSILLLLLLLFVGIAAFATAIEGDRKERAYGEGQVDALTGDISYVRLIKGAEAEKEYTLAYAQGADDVNDGDIRVKILSDSTYVWTKSPWGKDNPVPTDTFRIKR